MDAARSTSYAMMLIATGTVMGLGCVNKLIILSPSVATVSEKVTEANLIVDVNESVVTKRKCLK
jgi:hypothetical protein